MKFFQKANKSLFLVFSLVCLLAAHLATAQQVTQPKRNVDDLSDEEIAMFMERAQASGMTEAQIEQAAKTQGYTAADIAKMRSRISMVQGVPSSSESTGETGASIDEDDPFAKNNARSLNELGTNKSSTKTGKV